MIEIRAQRRSLQLRIEKRLRAIRNQERGLRDAKQREREVGVRHVPLLGIELARRDEPLDQCDELACITEICAANLTPAGRRMVETAPS